MTVTWHHRGTVNVDRQERPVAMRGSRMRMQGSVGGVTLTGANDRGRRDCRTRDQIRPQLDVRREPNRNPMTTASHARAARQGGSIAMQTLRDPDPPVVFVHLGSTLPSFLAANLRLAAANSGLDVILITNADVTRGNLDPVLVVKISDAWYSGEMVASFRARTSLSSDFRGGFWLFAVERFFILLEFMRSFDVTRVIHAESDVLVFDLRPLVAVLSQRPDRAFFPFPYQDTIIPSLCLFSGVEPLERVAAWMISTADHRNEMELLADYAKEYPSDLLFLPTDAWFGSRPSDWRVEVDCLPPEEIGGIVDANALGQWMFGTDPRNFLGPGWNRYLNPNAEHDLSRLRFRLQPGGGLRVSDCESEVRSVAILNLHVHSKAHRRIERGRLLRRVLQNLSRDRRTLITPGIRFTFRSGRPLVPTRIARAIRARRFRSL
jgi:hypothetical protein